MHAGLANTKEDIVTYAAKALMDPRTENKRVVICPAANKVSQNELVKLWERISGRQVNKKLMSAEELDKQIEGMRWVQLHILLCFTGCCCMCCQGLFCMPAHSSQLQTGHRFSRNLML